jgi:hypothetical protein
LAHDKEHLLEGLSEKVDPNQSYETAKTSLSRCPQQWQVAHAVRLALRSMISHGPPINQNDARCLLCSFRAVHSGFAWINEQTPEFEEIAREAYRAADVSTKLPNLSEDRALSVYPCGNVAWAAGNDAKSGSSRTFEEALAVYSFETQNADQRYLVESYFFDISSSQDFDEAVSIFFVDLNDPGTLSESVTRAENSFFEMLTNDSRDWSFWYEWYQGFITGKPLDWELQRRVAMIDNATWEAGPEVVAEEIKKIRAKYYLETRIEELEAELRNANIDRHGIGGNMPPEILDDASIRQELIIVWQPLEELKKEIISEDHDTTRLRKIIDALVTALKQGFAWCLKKGDLIVDTAIKWAIPAGGTGYLTLNPDKLEAVIEAAKRLLSVF